MRLTKKVFNDLAIWMIGFGILIGVAFPFLALLFGIDKSIALSWYFILSCVLTGALAGAVNISISRAVVAKRLKILTIKMTTIESNLVKVAQGLDQDASDFDGCRIDVDSEDEIGENIKAFNHLVETLSLTMKSELLTSQLNIEDLVDKALPQLLDTMNSIAGMILVEKEGELYVAKSYGIKSAESMITNDSILEVAKSHNRLHLKLPDDIIIDGLLTELRPREILVEPIKYKNINLGIVMLATIKNYSSELLLRLSILSKSLSLALHNAIVHDQMQKLAALDPLTGILNRRFGMVRLREEYSRSVRANIPLGIIMIDIDHFKNVNDTFGHLAGDKIIVRITKIIRRLLRDGDVFMRYGGEEFCLALPGASKEDTYKVAEKIRRIIAENNIDFKDMQINITLSLGISSSPENEIANEQELLSAADEALYISKENGRNQTTSS